MKIHRIRKMTKNFTRVFMKFSSQKLGITTFRGLFFLQITEKSLTKCNSSAFALVKFSSRYSKD